MSGTNVTVKSGANKDLLNPFEAIDERQLAILQVMVDEMHARFVEIIVVGRDMPEEVVRDLADGSIYSASTALEKGLIDEIGYWRDAQGKTAELLGVEDVKVIRYERNASFADLLFRTMHRVDFAASSLLNGGAGVRVQYMLR